MPIPINDECRTPSIREIVRHRKVSECKPVCRCTERKRKPRKPKRRVKCGRYEKGCSQRIERIAMPRMSHAEHTLERYGYILYPERVINMCRLVKELRFPQPQPLNLWKLQRRCKRRPKRKCRTARACEEWLDNQSITSSSTFRHYVSALRDYILNYRQLQVSAKLFRYMEFRKVRSSNKYVKMELKKICDKLAVLIDIKLQPYKQTLLFDKVSVTSLEDKHVIFKMFDFEYESETEIETIYEEEATLIPLSIYEFPTGYEIEEEEEEIEVAIEELQEMLYEIEEEEEIMEHVEEESIVEEAKVEELPVEEEELLGIAEAEQESIIGFFEEEERYEEVSIFEEEIAEEEMPEKEVLRPASEEESIMEAPEEEEEPDFHPPGTSSYVDWCLYVSWLREFGSNIEMYARCLEKFRCVILQDTASKHSAILQFLLKNWSKYLADSRRVDKEMTQYFKDKPMTWCSKCRDCTIDDYPRDHYIPPELEAAIRNTQEWRRMLAELEDYCRKLCAEEEGEEEGEEVVEMYEIVAVSSSSTSSYEIEQLPMPGKTGSSHAHPGAKKK